MGGLAAAAGLTAAADRAAAILTALTAPLQARYPDAPMRLADRLIRFHGTSLGGGEVA